MCHKLIFLHVRIVVISSQLCSPYTFTFFQEEKSLSHKNDAWFFFPKFWQIERRNANLRQNNQLSTLKIANRKHFAKEKPTHV